jgi:hypothetical protein
MFFYLFILGLPPLARVKAATVAVASPPQIFNPGTSPTPSVITKLLQPSHQRIGPFGGNIFLK